MVVHIQVRAVHKQCVCVCSYLVLSVGKQFWLTCVVLVTIVCVRVCVCLFAIA